MSPDPREDPERRFDRLQRLVGGEALARLRRSHVLVVGAGGVGSWAAESLARSGIGRLTVVDFDTVCIRNFNRQLQALSGNIGKPKAPLLAERLRLVNPEADIRGVEAFFAPATCDELLAGPPDFVVDAIDHVTAKCFLIKTCRERNIPLVVSTGSGGRRDPTRLKVADLARTDVDPLARAVRDILREKYGFPKRALFGVPAVFSPEPPARPLPGSDATDCKAGCLCPQGENPLQSCTKKSLVMGTASFVTGAFGLACASVVVRSLIGEDLFAA
ncbi:MAG: tRNA threonylcarbamoyladenosine dehydratase [Elusimicrobiota bacterium]|jgi:tRNA A37 threonylcarbamoyladenosine dehydratase